MATGSGSFGQKLRENAFSLEIYNKRLKFQPPTVYFHNYVSPLIVPKFKMAATKPEVGIFSHPNVNTDEIPTPTNEIYTDCRKVLSENRNGGHKTGNSYIS